VEKRLLLRLRRGRAVSGPDDLKAIEQRMRQIVRQGPALSPGVRSSDEQAREELAGEPYKARADRHQGRLGGCGGPDAGAPTAPSEVSVEEAVEGRRQASSPSTTNLDGGPTGEETLEGTCAAARHVPTTRQIPAFKLMRSGGAYWRGQ